MEEYVTKREFLELKKQVERHTGEMKPINVNVGSQDVLDRLDQLKQELDERSMTWLNTLQENYTEQKQEMAAMEERIIDAIRKYSQPGKN
jgi:phage shock protein A